MADTKLKGTFPFAANYEVTKADALDPRVRWDGWEQLVVKSNWPGNGDTVYIYKGLTASVGEELWILINDSKFIGRLNTVGLNNLLFDEHGDPIYMSTKEIADFLGWKIVGGSTLVANEHVLTVQ